MCVVSMIGDHYRDKWIDKDWWQPVIPQSPLPSSIPSQPTVTLPHIPPIPGSPFVIDESKITREEFDDLKKEVLEMKELLKRAKQYDIDNGEPDCEIEEKIALIKKVAEFVGVEIDIK